MNFVQHVERVPTSVETVQWYRWIVRGEARFSNGEATILQKVEKVPVSVVEFPEHRSNRLDELRIC